MKNLRTLKRMVLLSISFSVISCSRSYEYCGPIVNETYKHRYGMEVPEEHWVASGEHGQVITTLKNGIVVTKTYNNGILDGLTTYSFPHSQNIEREETYANGTLEKVIKNYVSGHPYQEIVYSNQNRTVTSWYENGSPKSQEEYTQNFLANGEYFSPEHAVESKVENGSGTIIQRDCYGLTLFTDTITNGQLSLRTSYHSNGSLKEITPYINQLVEGERKTFLPAGEPNSIETWVAGQQNGVTVMFQNGEKISEVPYKYGLKHGVEKRYRNGETLVEEATWEEGMKHGPSKCYLAGIVTTDWYFQNKKMEKSKYDFMTSPMPR